jgi:heme-degrading monooxygenase HmoA
MHARVSIVQFRDDAIEDATKIFRDIMLPAARPQKGFQGALILRNGTRQDQHIIISMWETEADMHASRAPEDIVPLLQPLNEYIIESNQEIYEVLLKLDGQSSQ